MELSNSPDDSTPDPRPAHGATSVAAAPAVTPTDRDQVLQRQRQHHDQEKVPAFDPPRLAENTHALPEELLLFSRPSAGGPLRASGTFSTPAFSVKEAQAQLSLFRDRLRTAAASGASGCASCSQPGATDDLGVDDCRLYHCLLNRRRAGGGVTDEAGGRPAEQPSGGQAGCELGSTSPGTATAPEMTAGASESTEMTAPDGKAAASSADDAPARKRARSDASATFTRAVGGHSSEEVFQHLQDRWSAATASGRLVALSEFTCPRAPPPVEGTRESSPAPDASESERPGSNAARERSAPERGPTLSAPVVDPEEVVVSVSVYHPYRLKEKTHEYLTLGSTTLSALCKKFYCLNSVMMSHFGVAKENEYLYVEGTFFNRTAPGSSACNLSDPIRKFCADIAVSAPPPDPSKPLPPDERPISRQPTSRESLRSRAQQTAASKRPLYPMRRTAMEGKTVRDLWLKVGSGAGNLYCHQGCCEHVVEFSDVRQIHASDSQSPSDYPALVYRYQPDRRRCSICRTRHAIKVTTCSDAAPEPVSFFCSECYLELHYAAGGALCPEASHNQFPYFHD